MNMTELWQDILALIPIAGFAAAVVASVVYVRYRGAAQAQQEIITTYERLDDVRTKEIDALKEEITDLNDKILSMEKEIHAQKLAFDVLTTQFADSVRYGSCVFSETCKDFRAPGRYKMVEQGGE